MKPLDQVLADWQENAAIAEKLGHEQNARLIRTILLEVREATEDYERWLTEAQVVVRSGCSARWWRARFPELAADGHAKRNEQGKRMYRQVAIPRRIRETRQA